jgi:hypothetical protein
VQATESFYANGLTPSPMTICFGKGFKIAPADGCE